MIFTVAGEVLVDPETPFTVYPDDWDACPSCKAPKGAPCKIVIDGTAVGDRYHHVVRPAPVEPGFLRVG